MVGTTGNPNSTTIIRLYGVFSIEMNSKERHEARYQRRKEKRLRRKQERNEQYGDFDKVFTFDNLYCAFKSVAAVSGGRQAHNAIKRTSCRTSTTRSAPCITEHIKAAVFTSLTLWNAASLGT